MGSFKLINKFLLFQDSYLNNYVKMGLSSNILSTLEMEMTDAYCVQVLWWQDLHEEKIPPIFEQ